MNKKTWWGVGAAVVIVVVAVVVMMGKGGAPGTAGGPQVAGNNSAPTSMKELFASNASQKCTFDSSTTNSQSSGVVLVASGHMRGDFTSVAGGKTIVSHMITDGATSYVWTDQMGQGYKMSFASMDSMNAGSGSQPAGSATPSPDSKVNYNCSGWSPDQSQFTVPTNITFSDMSAMMNAAAGASAGAGTTGGAKAGGSMSGNAAICAQCNAITNAQGKAQCMAAYSCQ